MSGTRNNDLGPLPKATRNDSLEHLAIVAFVAAMSNDRFLFRDERIDDKGVDGSLELKMGDSHTNLRSQVQLKATDSAETNHDGSVSLRVETSNFNYLLNGTSPLCVLFVVPRRELRYVWAYDEWKRLDADNPAWRNQQTVTLRFRQIVTTDAVNDIHDRIRREAQGIRLMRETLGRAAVGEETVVAISPTTFQVTNPDELYQFLLNCGMTAVSSGYAREVLQRVPLLRKSQNDLRIRLICAYAEYTLGKYAAAFGHLVEIAADEHQLAPPDRYFFQGLRNSCEFLLGRITADEYRSREAELDKNAPGVHSLKPQMAELKRRVLQSGDLDECRGALASFRKLVDEILSRGDVNESFKLYVRIELLEAEGSVLIDEFSFAATAKGMRDSLGLSFDTPASRARAAAVLGRKIEWIEAGNRIIEDAASLGHPVLLGSVLLVSTSVILTLLSQRRILSGLTAVPESMLNNLTQHLDQAIALFADQGALERELRARMLRADLHDFLGETAEAKKIAAEVLPKAQAMDYRKIVSHAEAISTGESSWAKTEERTASLGKQGEDIGLASQTDEQVRAFAKYAHAALDLPLQRLGFVERNLLCMRDAARERLSWCRHLHIVGEDPSFATEPIRQAACATHRYRSNVGDQDWTAIIVAFKHAYCHGCSEREPIGAAPLK